MLTINQIVEKLSSRENEYGESYRVNDNETAYLTCQAYHGCRPGYDRVWVAPAILINEDKREARKGYVTWDFDGVEWYDECDDAGNYPWDDKSSMDWEEEGTVFDLTSEDDVTDLLEDLR